MLEISFKIVKPTKTNLNELQKQLNFMKKGEKFLEYKREQLSSEIKESWADFTAQQKTFSNIIQMALKRLIQCYRDMGRSELKLISKIITIESKPLIKVHYHKHIGIFLPQIESVLGKSKDDPSYSFENTSYHLDDLVQNNLTELFKQLISIVETEDKMLRLAITFNSVSRRINGLKNIIIPDLSMKIKTIRDLLEEIERENFVRLKKIKDLLNKKLKDEDINEDS